MGLRNFDIITGVDGDYVVKGGILVKITGVEKSPDYDTSKKGVWKEYTLSDGQKLRFNTVVGIDKKKIRGM